MPMRRAAGGLLVWLMAVVAAPAAVLQGRQASAAAEAAAGAISGTIRSESGTPLTRARVQLRSPDLAHPRVTLTDAAGAFAFDALPPGDYQLVPTHTGHVMPHAAGGPGSSVRVRLGPGASRTSVDIRLERAAVIPGRILDEDGSPLAGADVEALSLRVPPGQQPAAVAATRSDDRGMFRLTGLPAGQYYVLARDPAFSNVGNQSGPLTYAPTYHPGVLSLAEARPITVAAGAESEAVEMQLRLVPPARVSGTIETPDRRALSSAAVLLIASDGSTATTFSARDVEFLPDGRFSLRNVTPGRYLLRVQGSVDRGGPLWFGNFSLTVDGQDVGRIPIVLSRGAAVQGRVEISRSPLPAEGLTGMRVRAPLADGSSFGDSPGGIVAPDGSFEIRGVMPGSHYFRVEGLHESLIVISVRLEGQDILDRPLQLDEGQRIEDLTVVIGPATAGLRGVVRAAAGGPSADTLVVTTTAFPVRGSTANPRFHMTRTDSEGRYALHGLPPGDYRVAAPLAVDELTVARRDWLDRLAQQGTAVTVPPAGGRVQDLTALPPSAAPTTAFR